MTRPSRLLLFLMAAGTLAAAEPVVLQVTAPGKNLALSAAQFAALPHIVLLAVDPHDRHAHHYAGVALREILIRADAPLGEKLRGTALQLVVIARARDNYAVAFTLADFEEAFNARTILLAEQEDGKMLSDTLGPLRLSVSGDQQAARWEKMVSAIEIVSVAPPGAVGKPVGAGQK